MTPPDNPPPVASSPDSLGDSRGSVQFLLHLFCLLALVVIILSGSYCVYLLREISVVRRQVEGYEEFVANYNKSSVPVLKEFHSKLSEFAQAHPDFQSVLGKYGLVTNTEEGLSVAIQYEGDTNEPAARIPVIPAE